jgi:HEAT repeat protein
VDHPGSEFGGIDSVFEEQPAGAALAKIGDPAIPALLQVAENGSRQQRQTAPTVIAWIRTPKAHQALESLLSETKDPEIKETIETLLHTFGQGPPELKGPQSPGSSATQGVPGARNHRGVMARYLEAGKERLICANTSKPFWC